MKAATEFGRAFARGVLAEIATWFGLGMLSIAVLTGIGNALGYGWDSTDDQASGVHSQMRPRLDNLTGCQYLENAGGALTPRLGKDGKQICRP